jgi:hypothetical protein
LQAQGLVLQGAGNYPTERGGNAEDVLHVSSSSRSDS